MFFRRLLAILTPLVIALGFELFYYFQSNINILLGVTVVLFFILFISLKLLIDEKIVSKNFWGLSALPLLFYIFITNYLLILGFGILRHLVIIIFVFIMYAYLENLFMYYFHRASYQINSLENSAIFLNIILFFLLVLDLYAWSILLNLPLWLLSLFLTILLCIMLWQLWWILKIKNPLKLLYIFSILILTLEFFWCLSFLPLNFYILAAILLIIYYFLTGILRAKISGELDKKVFSRYAIISGILMVIILITSHWI